MPSLPTQSVDLLLTDPPYGIRYRSSAKSGAIPDRVHNDDNLNALRGALPLIDAALKPDRHAYVFAAPSKIGEATAAIEQYWRIKNVIVWDKGNAGSKGDLEAGYAMNWEALVYANKGRRALAGPRPRAIFRYDWQGSRDPVHPTIKPVEIFRGIIARSSQASEMLLDPFCGTGPALIAAAELGRRAVGIELEERYCEIAAKRVEITLRRTAIAA
ncbi:MAG TPA: site-specific DNA-methyltransferase [Bryobacteraceae bacterium]|nr:site-specific DNA-methyltransferase [Bryobacteraceae bacterium]